MARRAVTRFVRPAPRTSVWVGFSLAATITASTATIIGTLNAAALALRPFTIVRTRGYLLWSSDQAAVNEDPRGVMGWTVVSEEAAAAGAASLPDPSTNSDASWFVYEPYAVDFQFLSSVGFDGDSGMGRMVDSKAMRKVENNDQMTVIATEVGAHGAVIKFIGRMLVKLH